MKISKLQASLLVARADSILQNIPTAMTQPYPAVSVPLAENFNSILEEVKLFIPTELNGSLPKLIDTVDSDLVMLGHTEASMKDLKIFLDQTIAIIDVLVKHAD